MSLKRSILLAIAATFFGAGLWAGCTVGFDPAQEDTFPCTTNDDCIQGYECAETTQLCQKIDDQPPEAPPCDQTANPEGDIDQDNDGYGTGDNRTNCPAQKRAEDCDDTDPERNPGQAELCDGKDNDCDGQVDNFECESVSDCGSPPAEYDSYLSYRCINNQCVMKPDIQPPNTDCPNMQVTCDTQSQAFTYESGGQTYNADEGPITTDCDL